MNDENPQPGSNVFFCRKEDTEALFHCINGMQSSEIIADEMSAKDWKGCTITTETPTKEDKSYFKQTFTASADIKLDSNTERNLFNLQQEIGSEFDVAINFKPKPITRIPRKWKGRVPGSNRNTRGRRKYTNLLMRNTRHIQKAICGRLKIEESIDGMLKGTILPSGMLTYNDKPNPVIPDAPLRKPELVISKEQMQRIKDRIGEIDRLGLYISNPQ